MATDIPTAMRGKMKLWFTEIKPNVFISGVSDFLSNKIVEYLMDQYGKKCEMTVIQSSRTVPGFKVLTNTPDRDDIEVLTGYPMVKKSIGKT